MTLLPGEPTWLTVFSRGTADDRERPAATFRSPASEWSLSVEFGGDPHRPEIAERDGCAVVLDGFLTDRTSLGSNVVDRGDPELLLTAYLEQGEAVLPKLRGAFCAVIWDGRQAGMLCVRDLAGTHPLFYSQLAEGGVAVAASQGALLEVGRVSDAFDRLAIARWVFSLDLRPSTTFYGSIERLPPGHLLAATPDGGSIRRHWHPAAAGSRADVEPSEALDRFEELLDQAVARWASFGSLGVYLSGGADSAAVAASAKVVSRTRSLAEPVALSFIFPEPADSEEAAERSIADGLGIPQLVVPLDDTISNQGLLADAVRLTEQSWLPPVNPWAASYVALAKEGRARGCRTILTGDGGNTWFEPEWSEVADLVRSMRLLEIRRLWLSERGVRTSSASSAQAFVWSHGVRLVLRNTTLRALGRLAPDARAALRRHRLEASLPRVWALPDDHLRRELVDQLVEDASELPGQSYRAFGDETKLESAYLYQPAESFFLTSRRLGLPIACPVLDPDLVGFLYGLPNSLLCLGGRAKGLPRESVRRRAGNEPANNLGIGRVDAYFAKLLRHEAPDILTSLGGFDRLENLGIAKSESLKQAFMGDGLGQNVGYYEAWQVLACEAWLRSRTGSGETRRT